MCRYTFNVIIYLQNIYFIKKTSKYSLCICIETHTHTPTHTHIVHVLKMMNNINGYFIELIYTFCDTFISFLPYNTSYMPRRCVHVYACL